MTQSKSIIYLIPCFLTEEAAHTIPPYIIDAVKNCQVFFVENERTARRFLKNIWKTRLPGQEMVIDDYEWFVISDDVSFFKQKIKEGKNIGVLSEAGCPGVADPGQVLVAVAHEMNADVKPLVGPSSILLALMASGLNGQQFQFIGYLPVKEQEREKKIRELEAESSRKNCTQIFIETPYRNNSCFDSLLKVCNPHTRLSIAVELTGHQEWIKTKTIREWKNQKPSLHKKPAILCFLAEEK